MGLQNYDRSVYLSINADGKITRKVNSSTPGAIARINKKGDTIYEAFNDTLSGIIADVQKDDSDYGLQWKVFVNDGEDKFIVTMGYTSNTAKAFLKMFPNVDLSKEVTFAPTMKEEDGNKNVSLFLYQDSKLVPYAFKKDEPNGMPERQLLKDPKTGKDTWSYVDQIEWLSKKAQEHLGNAVKPEVSENEETADGEQPVAKAKSLDDF